MFVNVTRPAKTEIVVSDLSARAIADVPVTVSLAREEWFYGREQASAAEVPRRRRSASGSGRKRRLASGPCIRRSTPVPLDIPLKDGGSYVLHATAVDASGRHTRTDVRFYGIGGGAVVVADGRQQDHARA